MRNTYLSATARRFVKTNCSGQVRGGGGVGAQHTKHHLPFSSPAVCGRDGRRLRKVRNPPRSVFARSLFGLSQAFRRHKTRALYLHNAYVVALQRRGVETICMIWILGEAKIDAIGKGKGFLPGSMHNAQCTRAQCTKGTKGTMAQCTSIKRWRGPQFLSVTASGRDHSFTSDELIVFCKRWGKDESFHVHGPW